MLVPILIVIGLLVVMELGILLCRRPLSRATRQPRQPWPVSPGEEWVKLTIRYEDKIVPLLLTQHELAMGKERASRQPEIFATES